MRGALPNEETVAEALHLLENALALAGYTEYRALAKHALDKVLEKGLMINNKTSAQSLFNRAKAVVADMERKENGASPEVTDTPEVIEDIEAELGEIVDCIELSGSPKQVAWAEKIRLDCMKWVALELYKLGKDAREVSRLLASDPYTWAKTWIDGRSNLIILAQAIGQGQKVKV